MTQPQSDNKTASAQAQLGDVFPVSCHERDTEAEPGQVSRVVPAPVTPAAKAWLKCAELLPEIQLQEHQQRIADRITEEDPRLLVYHGLGSGKSLSSLAAAEAAKKRHGDEYGVVVPASLRENFQKEIKKFTRGSDPEILSYTGLALGKDFQRAPETLIMDEAHRLRNPGAASAQGAARAAARAKRLMLLTGSPITNSPTDMANLLALLHNKQITPEEFEARYIGYKKVRPGLFGWLRGAKPGMRPMVKNEDELRRLLAGKVDYQPSKTPQGVNVAEQVVRVPLSPEQKKIQTAIRTKIPPGFLWKLDQEFPLSRDELAKLNSFLSGMRQVSLSTRPFRADKDAYKAFQQSSKLQKAMENLQKELGADKRKKAIIYSNFIGSGLAPYAAGLEKAKVPHAFFHGGISPAARQAAVDAYNQGKLRALLIGPAGAEGLSTKGTSLIQLLDPHWHESRSQQAKGRGLRFDSHEGLPEELKNVAVQRYLSASDEPSFFGKLMGYGRERTGDEVLERLADEKEQLNEEFRRILKEEGDKYRKQKEQEKQSIQRHIDAWAAPEKAAAFPRLNFKALTTPFSAIKNTFRPGVSQLKSTLRDTSRMYTDRMHSYIPPKMPMENVSNLHRAIHREAAFGAKGFFDPAMNVAVAAGNPTTGRQAMRHELMHAVQQNTPNKFSFPGVAGSLANAPENTWRNAWGKYLMEMNAHAAAERGFWPQFREGARFAFSPNRADAYGFAYGPKYHTIHNTMSAPFRLSGAVSNFFKNQMGGQPIVNKTAAANVDFQPDFTPGQLHRMGVYKALYEKEGPRLASLGEWKPEWVTEHDPKGWLEWYQNYNSGRRIPDEDERQIKRWRSFKARHGGPFMKNPTPRRGWALRNWAIDPAKLVAKDQSEQVNSMLQDYQEKAVQRYIKRRFAETEMAENKPAK